MQNYVVIFLYNLDDSKHFGSHVFEGKGEAIGPFTKTGPMGVTAQGIICSTFGFRVLEICILISYCICNKLSSKELLLNRTEIYVTR